LQKKSLKNDISLLLIKIKADPFLSSHPI